VDLTSLGRAADECYLLAPIYINKECKVMAETIQTIAALVAIIFTPIGCWLAYKNIPKEKVGEFKKEIYFAKELIIFLLVIAALSVLFMLEMLSTAPLTRVVGAKMCIFASLAVTWVCLYGFSFLVNMGLRQAVLIRRHLNITETTVEHVFKNVR
jgi:hypothetical protein